ncbi:MAG TPA: hypothetical protein VMU13_03225 [Candidatus Paceibacterota bacterium]|nr:hypothetical protein [Candidatus Paceibacterota bacterium]
MMNRSILHNKTRARFSTKHRKVAHKSFLENDQAHWDDVHSLEASYWQREGGQRALKLFKTASVRIPAYKDFLKKNRVNPDIITTADFNKLPETSKENYINAYPLEACSWDGTLDTHRILAISSGTSGEPTLWPRGTIQEREAAAIHEFIYTQLFNIDTHRTLLVIGFPMGLYVSGVATSLPSFVVSVTHPKLTIATVGNQKDQILTLLKHTGDTYEQIILVGHPFFLKDVLETGMKEGIKWHGLHTRMLSCSEGFTEAWRDYVSTIAGKHGEDVFFNTYGSSEFLLMGFENPHTIAIRKAAGSSEVLSRRLFGSSEPPGLFQFNPLTRFIESNGTDLLVTANAGIPLIRFNQHDAGNIYTFEDIQKQIKSTMSITKHLKENHWKPWHLPFVTLFGRSDHTLVFYAANIYPEHIRIGLEDKVLLKKLTGNFLMRKTLSNMEQTLHIHVEMRPSIRESTNLASLIKKKIVQTLLEINQEYKDASLRNSADLTPHISLHSYHDAHYFKPGTKHHYIDK